MIKLDNVPTLNRGGKKIYDWKNSIGCMITCINDKTNESIEVPIVRYENRTIYVLVHKKEIPINTGHIENCKCGKIFGTYTPEYKYKVGDIIGNRKIIKRYKIKSQMKFYEWECVDCSKTGNTQEQTGIDFEWQYIINDYNRLYDFYIPSLNMICEVHGEQHYRNSGFGRLLDKEQLNDIQKEEYAMLQGYKYCIIDARKSKMEWMKENIISSSIYLELNCPIIDWLECERAATGTMIYDVCKYISENPDCKYDEVEEYFHITENRVKDYSKHGIELFEWYNHKEKKYTGKIHTVKIYYKDKEIITISDSYNNISKYLREEQNVNIERREIQHICNGKYFSNKGYHFELVA